MARTLDEKVLVAWNAAYWLARSEASRQQQARYPDCDWRVTEMTDEMVSAVVTAQADVCIRAMQGPSSAHLLYT